MRNPKRPPFRDTMLGALLIRPTPDGWALSGAAAVVLTPPPSPSGVGLVGKGRCSRHLGMRTRGMIG